MRFTAECGDYNFFVGVGVNTPTAFARFNEQLLAAAQRTGRDVGAYALFMVIADETDGAAMAKWRHYASGLDIEALDRLTGQANQDKAASSDSNAKTMSNPERAVNLNMGTLIGSYRSVARMLDEAATVPGTKGIMLTFDDFIVGLDRFGQHIQPLMTTRHTCPRLQLAHVPY